jgi:DNA mismatch repair protein MutS
MASSKISFMQQHAEAKAAHPDAIVFFRLGDFYEMFGDDAVRGSQLLDLTLTSRNKGKPDEVPMAGVPHHAAHGYIARLLAAGQKVALCEQMADPKTTKGIVPREVVRVITPATAIHEDQLEGRENNWLAALEVQPREVGLGFFDVSTGELTLGSVTSVAAALGELARVRPKEVLVGAAAFEGDLEELLSSVRQTLPRAIITGDEPLSASALAELLPGIAGSATSDAPLMDAGTSDAVASDAALLAAGRSVRFARACNPGRQILPLRSSALALSDHLLIDPTAQAHLELVRSASDPSGPTLLQALDLTCTVGGSRLLRRRLCSPLKDVAQIRRRLDLVEAFVFHSALRNGLRRELEAVTDLERLSVRAGLGEATPRDLGRLRDGLIAARAATRWLSEPADPELRVTLQTAAPIDTLDELVEILAKALVENPPAQPKDGAVFRSEYDPELSELHGLCQTGAQHMSELESRLRSATDIPTLKVRYTRVFGWYIEVSRGHARRVPESWRRKQTVASGERYTLPELDELADKIEHAEERYRIRERELTTELLAQVKAASQRLARLAGLIAAWDVAAALAEVAQRYDYTRPEVDASDLLEIVDGRHPVVERFAAAGRFVPNDVRLEGSGERLWIITGPNMAGKSTLLRQTALITILAQMGSYVPARQARIGVVDRVLSRVGASDNLARGESTFMVEMRETAEILRSASPLSLVIVDEIGRGTSTFDGLAIAWAVAEHLAQSVRCRTLFATHYHEITALGAEPHTSNHSVSAREIDGDVVFLHRLVPGPASQSYGVAVAKLAGLPREVLARASELLAGFEGGGTLGSEKDGPLDHSQPQPEVPRRARKADGVKGHGPRSSSAWGVSPQNQLSLFAVAEPPQVDKQLIDMLRSANLSEMDSAAALSLLARIKERLLS